MHWQIRAMENRDIEAVAEIERICFTEPWTEEAFRAVLLLPYAHYYAAEADDGTLIGEIGLTNAGGDGEISNVAVLPQYRQRGIAHALMEYLLQQGQAMGIRDFTLEVRESNHAARALYESFGFAQEGRRRHFYRQPDEDALILWKRQDS